LSAFLEYQTIKANATIIGYMMVEFGDIIMELASYLSPVDYEVEIVWNWRWRLSLLLYSIDSVDSESSGERNEPEPANRQRNRPTMMAAMPSPFAIRRPPP